MRTEFLTEADFKRAFGEAWKTPRLRAVKIAVAYASTNGIETLLRQAEPVLKKLKNANEDEPCALNIIVGVNDNATTAEALERLMGLKDRMQGRIECRAALNLESRFHPKFYLFLYNDHARLIVGSANLTTGAMAGNEECLTLTIAAPHDPLIADADVAFQNWSRATRPITPSLIASRHEQERKRELALEPLTEELNSADAGLKTQWSMQAAGEPVPLTFQSRNTEQRLLQLLTHGKVIRLEIAQEAMSMRFENDPFKLGRSVTARGTTVSANKKSTQRGHLLSTETRHRLSHEQDTARKNLSQYRFSTPWGDFVPDPALPRWLTEQEKCEQKFREVLVSLATRNGQNKELARLQKSVREECPLIWQRHHGNKSKMPDARVASVVQQAVREFKKAKDELINNIRMEWVAMPIPLAEQLLASHSTHESGEMEAVQKIVQQKALQDKERLLKEFAASLIITTREMIVKEYPKILKLVGGETKQKHIADFCERLCLLNFYGDRDLDSYIENLRVVSQWSGRRVIGQKTFGNVKNSMDTAKESAALTIEAARGWPSASYAHVLEQFASIVEGKGVGAINGSGAHGTDGELSLF